MAFEQKDGQGSLFVNDKKVTPNQPDYTGTAKLFGRTLRLSAWEKESPRGKWLSISLQEKGVDIPKEAPKPKAPNPLDDEIPF